MGARGDRPAQARGMTSRIRARQSLGRLLWSAGRRQPVRGMLTVLMYHSVTREPVDDAGQMSVSADRFARQMTELHASGADVVDLAEGVARLRGGTLDRPAVAIVFD